MSELRIYTLGGLRLELDGQPLRDAVPAKGRALLAYLAVSGGRAGRSRLAGLLWSDRRESAARANLRLTLSKLRRAVPQVQADRSALWLEGSWWVDAEVLEALAEDPAAADPWAVLELSDGEFLDGVAFADAGLFDEWVMAHGAHLRSTVLRLLDAVISRAVAGRAAEAGVAAARRLLDVEPANERAHRALMQLFVAAGQPSAALAQFDTCTQALHEEFGEQPTEQTAALADEIRRSAVEVAVGPRRAGVPTSGTSFVGRAAELTRLSEMFADPACRLVTIVGPGGVGKTRLALEFADRHRAVTQTAVVSLAGIPPATDHTVDELVTTTLAAGLGIDLALRRDPFEVLIDGVTGRDLLLVVDNLEHLAGAGVVLGRMLAAAERVRILATSRRRLGIGAEWVVGLTGLPTPTADVDDDPAAYDAVRLFTERARAADAGDRLDATLVAAVCCAVGGMPLAIELAARRAATVPLSEMADHLAGELDLLAGAGDPDARHRSVRAALDWSWDLLARDTASGLARLSVFPAEFDAAAARTVTDVDLLMLSTLVEHSLVQLDDGRYRLHQLVRHYAADRAARVGGLADELADRHAAWVAVPLAVAPGGDDAPGLDDVRAATNRMLSHADTDDLAMYLGQLAEHHRRRSYWSELRTVAETALDRSDVPAVHRAAWLELVAQSHGNVGRATDAIHKTHEALAALGRPPPTSRQLRRRVGRTGALVASSVGLLGSPERREVARLRARLLQSLGQLYYVAERFDRIPPLSVESLVEARVARDPSALAVADGTAALAAVLTGRFQRARRYRSRADNHAADAHASRAAAAESLALAVIVSVALGDWQDATTHAERALEACDHAARHRTAEFVLAVWAFAAYHTGDLETALRRSENLVTRAHGRGALATTIAGHLGWAEVGVRAGLLDEATDHVAAALELTDRIDLRIDRVRAVIVLARAAVARRDWDSARQHLDIAVDTLADRPAFSVHSLEAHAGVPEVALDLIERGDGVTPRLVSASRRGQTVLRAYARAVPIAVPRLLLVDGRIAFMHGRRRVARRAFERSLRHADRLGMPVEAAHARRLLDVAGP